MKLKAYDIAIIGICAAVYAVVGRLTDFGFNVGGVAFWPAALIPAVFAALFGPWIGGFGAAIGIFIRDMIFHGDPLLSLTAGVTGNFAAFFIIGYITKSKFDNKKTIISALIGSIIIISGILIPTIILPAESAGFTQLSMIETIILFFITVISSLAIIAIVG